MGNSINDDHAQSTVMCWRQCVHKCVRAGFVHVCARVCVLDSIDTSSPGLTRRFVMVAYECAPTKCLEATKCFYVRCVWGKVRGLWGKGKVDGWVWVQACSWTLINVACHSRISASICTSLVHNPSAMSREPWLWCPFYYSRFSYTSSSLKIEVINDTLMVWPSVQEVEKCEMLNYLIEMSNERDSTIRLHGEVFSIHMENYHFIFALLHRNTCLNGTRYWRKATA